MTEITKKKKILPVINTNSPKEEKDEKTVLNEIRFLEATGRVKLNITKFDY